MLELLDAIVDRGSPVSANRAAALLEQMFKFGIHRRIVREHAGAVALPLVNPLIASNASATNSVSSLDPSI